MSEDNACGFYCQQPDGFYYTIGLTNRFVNPNSVMAYIIQLHNGIYSESAVQYLQRVASNIIDRSKPIILVAHQFAGDAIVAFNETVKDLNVKI